MYTIAVLSLLLPQSVPDQRPSAAEQVRVELVPRVPGDGDAMRWSPKGHQLPLAAAEGGELVGEVRLGDDGARSLRLERSDGAEHFDRLRIDLDGDGAWGDGELLTCEPREQRGKWWSSFSCTVPLRVPAEEDGQPATSRAYPISLWYVFDPVEPDSDPVLRFTRRGWHEGEVTIGGEPATVLITDSVLDGRFDRRDAWRISRDAAATRTGSRSLSGHDWLDGAAWRVHDLDPHGRWATLVPFDPGVTEAEERAAADIYAADRRAPRADRPLAFRHDVDAAMEAAAAKGATVFLDFETTWCGPCKQMDRFVYTASQVVEAAQGIVCIKVDGDERRDLTRRYEVKGYPTLLILDADGNVLRRAGGYQSVAATARFLRGD